MLRCGHKYCRECIGEHARRRVERGGSVACPQCQRPVASSDLRRLLGEEELQALMRAAHARSPPAGGLQQPEEAALHAQFAEWAHHKGVRCCPQCKAWVLKEGGCDTVACICGARFKWSESPIVSVGRCHHLHPHHRLPLWCSTCPDASWIAKTKLALRRCMILPILLTLGIPLAVLAAPFAMAGVVSIAVVLDHLQRLQ